VRGQLPAGGRKRGDVEMYDRARFFTVTGRRLDTVSAAVEPRQDELAALHAEVFAARSNARENGVFALDAASIPGEPGDAASASADAGARPAPGEPGDAVPASDRAGGEDGGAAPGATTAPPTARSGTYSPDTFLLETSLPAPSTPGLPSSVAPALEIPPVDSPGDAEVLRRARLARAGRKFDDLYAGRWEGYFPDRSQSEADLALCALLSAQTRAPGQIDRLFRASGLMRPKWDERRGEATYGDRTIRTALAPPPAPMTASGPRQAGLGAIQYPFDPRVGEATPVFAAGSSESDAAPVFATDARDAAGPGVALMVVAAPIALTDLGNAERLVRAHGLDLRYCHRWGTWLVYDGQRWRTDETDEVARRAKTTVRAIAFEAAVAADERSRRDLMSHARRSEAESRLRALVALAESEPGIPITPDEIDRDPWLLNVANGTIDLRTGELRPHRREDWLTKLTPIDYDPAAGCPTWLAFLDRVMAGRAELVDYWQRVLGYALTGDVGEQVLFFLHGAGSNGKTTLLNVVLALVGDYGKQAPPDLLLAKRGDGNHPTEIADLLGARVVTTVEVEDGRRLAESLVKQLTGGDRLKARFMRQDFFEFDARFKLFLAANHRPVIRGTDHAIWRRVRLIPFDVTIPPAERDRTLPEKLRAELPGILAWAVQGCLAWQREGLGLPDAVASATQSYRAEMDTLADFLAERCVLTETATATSKALFAAYRAWCEETGEKAMTQKAFTTRLSEHGLRPGRAPGGTRIWTGIGLTGEPL
jgi:P4 family phage/plasmid primase-like protien